MADKKGYYRNEGQEEVGAQVAAGQELSDRINSGDEGGKSGGMTRGIASGIASKTPVGRVISGVTGWGKAHKKGVVTGGGILGTIVGVAIFISSLQGPLLIAQANIFQDFNFGPGDRSAVSRTARIKASLSAIRGAGSETELSRKANSINDIERAGNTKSRNVARAQRRFNFRSLVTRFSGGRATWRGTLQKADSPGKRSSRVLYGVDSDSRRSGNERLGRDLSADQIDKVRNSDNPRASARGLARVAVGRSIVAGALASACISSVAADAMPTEEDIYELILKSQADFFSSAGQLADGETADSDQLADLLDSLHYTEETIGVDPSDIEGLSSEEIAEIEAEIDRVLQEVGDGEDDVSVDSWLEDNNNIEGVRLESKEQVRSFSNSAAWKRATNQEVSGSEMDYGISFATMEDQLREGPAGFVLGTGDAINFLTVGLAPSACRFIMNPIVAWTLTAVDAVTTLVACVGSFGAGCGVRAAAFGLSELLIRGASWAIMSVAFNSLAPEGPEQLMGYVDMGANMGESENSRVTQGAPPVTNAQANTARENHFRKLATEDREQGVVWRYLSLKNHRSVLTRLAVSNSSGNISFSGVLRSVASIPGKIPGVIKSALFTKASAQEENFNNYDIQQYRWSEEELAAYDPLTNSRYVESLLRCADGAAQSGDNCTEVRIDEGEVMREILDKCIEAGSYLEIKDEELCTDPSSTERTAWVRVGLWKFDQEIIESLDCLSHDGPCGNEPGGNAPPTTGDVESHPDLGSPQPNGYYQLPDAPNGEYSWNGGTPPGERCGSRQLVDFSYSTAMWWYGQHQDRPLVMGDLNAAGHLSHRYGVDVDVYGPDGYFYGQRPMIPADEAIEMGKWMYDTGIVKMIFYNDPAVYTAVSEYAGNSGFMTPEPGHWNHFHVRLNDEFRGPRSESCGS